MKEFFYYRELPARFIFPKSFIDFIDTNPKIDLTPWWFLHERGNTFRVWLKEIKIQYPERKLVPFAMLNYCDDMACFDASIYTDDPKVFYVHVFASPGWEDRGYVDNFGKWLELAIQEAREYQAEDA